MQFVPSDSRRQSAVNNLVSGHYALMLSGLFKSFRDVKAVSNLDLRLHNQLYRTGRDRLPAGAKRMRQDHHAPPDSRVRHTGRGDHTRRKPAGGRPGRQRGSREAPSGYGVPGGSVVSTSQRGAEYRVRAEKGEAAYIQGCRSPADGKPRGIRWPFSAPALRGTTATGGPGAGAGAGPDTDGRAFLQPRRRAAGATTGGSAGDFEGAGSHGGLRHT